MIITTSTERVDGVKVPAGLLREQAGVSWFAMIRCAIITTIMVNFLSVFVKRTVSIQHSGCSAVPIILDGA